MVTKKKFCIAFSYGREFFWYFSPQFKQLMQLAVWTKHFVLLFLTVVNFSDIFPTVATLDATCCMKITVASLFITVVNLSDILPAVKTVDATCCMNKTFCIAFSYGRAFFWYFSQSCNTWCNLLTEKYQLHRFFLRS